MIISEYQNITKILNILIISKQQSKYQNIMMISKYQNMCLYIKSAIKMEIPNSTILRSLAINCDCDRYLAGLEYVLLPTIPQN